MINFRLIHSPTQLSTFDQSIREAQVALDSVAQVRRDFSDRWRNLERLMRTQLRSRSQAEFSTPSASRKDLVDGGGGETTQRLSGLFKFGQRRLSVLPFSATNTLGIGFSSVDLGVSL